ncbi:hypothetical protein [Nocardia australiensis]|uniref:hypothetical protein n=1 Tax=Nocardia australiensis TaxID=2887191 RepID=UPI001D141115|nr:hypothetical protein [Nocardia australiensis]
MRRDRLRTTESPDGRKVAIWRLLRSGAHILRIQNRADATPAYRWPDRKVLPATAPDVVLFDDATPPDLATVREAFPGHLDLWDALREDLWAALLDASDLPASSRRH